MPTLFASGRHLSSFNLRVITSGYKGNTRHTATPDVSQRVEKQKVTTAYTREIKRVTTRSPAATADTEITLIVKRALVNQNNFK